MLLTCEMFEGWTSLPCRVCPPPLSPSQSQIGWRFAHWYQMTSQGVLQVIASWGPAEKKWHQGHFHNSSFPSLLLMGPGIWRRWDNNPGLWPCTWDCTQWTTQWPWSPKPHQHKHQLLWRSDQMAQNNYHPKVRGTHAVWAWESCRVPTILWLGLPLQQGRLSESNLQTDKRIQRDVHLRLCFFKRRSLCCYFAWPSFCGDCGKTDCCMFVTHTTLLNTSRAWRGHKLL